MSTILITGGAGFVGSNMAVYFRRHFKKSRIIVLDNFLREGSRLNARRLKEQGIGVVQGDVRRKRDLDQFSGISAIVDCAAQPSVLASYADPTFAINTNLMGTVHCLELARRCKAAFIFLSSSRVYPIAPLEAVPYRETATRFDYQPKSQGPGFSYHGINVDFPLNGVRSLYGATKLGAEQLVLEYGAMYGFPVVINRWGLIAGPWQMGRIDQGLVGFWVIRHVLGLPLSYIGYGGLGKQVRDAVHVDDVCAFTFKQLAHLNNYDGQVLQVGGGRNNSFSLRELTSRVARLTGKKNFIGADVQARPGDVRIYLTDIRHAIREQGFSPKNDLEDILQDIYNWASCNRQYLEKAMK